MDDLGSLSSSSASPSHNLPWHHLPDGTFRNPLGSPVRPRVGMGRMLSFMRRAMRVKVRADDIPAHHIVPRTHAHTVLEKAMAGEGDFITWLGHASFLLRLGGQTILTDPYLTSRAGPSVMGPRRFAPSGIAIRALPQIDILVISHNHYDHLDDRTLGRLPNKAHTQVLTPLGLGNFFAQRGFSKITEMDWYHTGAFYGLSVTATPVVHWSRRIGYKRNTTLWAGFVFEAGGRRLFFGGDSGYGPVFSEIGERLGPFDMALLGIGAYEPRTIMRSSHATPEEAVQIGLDIGARTLVGMHWGTVTLTLEPPFEPPVRFRKAGLDRGYEPEDVWLMSIGETRPLPDVKSGN
ncbi:MAG: MBL fold metallo-hydrolase [Parvularculales bacterium]